MQARFQNMAAELLPRIYNLCCTMICSLVRFLQEVSALQVVQLQLNIQLMDSAAGNDAEV